MKLESGRKSRVGTNSLLQVARDEQRLATPLGQPRAYPGCSRRALLTAGALLGIAWLSVTVRSRWRIFLDKEYHFRRRPIIAINWDCGECSRAKMATRTGKSSAVRTNSWKR